MRVRTAFAGTRLGARLTVIGCGHLGATHAACMAEIGHEVLGVDIDEDKVALLNEGRAWFAEPGLDEMLTRLATTLEVQMATVYLFSDDGREFVSPASVGVGGTVTKGHRLAVDRGVAGRIVDDRARNGAAPLPAEHVGDGA